MGGRCDRPHAQLEGGIAGFGISLLPLVAVAEVDIVAAAARHAPAEGVVVAEVADGGGTSRNDYARIAQMVGKLGCFTLKIKMFPSAFRTLIILF